MNIRDAILTSVNSHQGIKGVELALNVMGLTNPLTFTPEEFATEVEQLIRNKEIVELEYILPEMDYRIKTLYFPKGTRLQP